jgi:hydroxysqualene synthase
MVPEQAPAATQSPPANTAGLVVLPYRPNGRHGLTASAFFEPFIRADLQPLYDTLAALRTVAETEHFVEETREYLLDRIEQALMGEMPPGDQEPTEFTLAALRAYQVQAQGRLDPQWALRLVQSAKRDVTRPTCATWPDLMLYCRYAAEPLGRAVLQLHHVQDTEIERATDALCAALLVLRLIRHAGTDWRLHGRCYLPTDWFTEAGGTPEQLVEKHSSPAVQAVIGRALSRTQSLLVQATLLPDLLREPRLRAEAVRLLVIAKYQHRQLLRLDPLRKTIRTPLFVRLAAHCRGWLAVNKRWTNRVCHLI